MIYVNGELGKVGDMLYDFYTAVTINDFLKSRKEIPQPTEWKRMVFVPWFGSDVVIDFSNVILDFEEKGYRIHDLTGEFYSEPCKLPGLLTCWSARRKNITEGNYSELSIRYNPITDRKVLHYAKKIGPPQPKKELEEIVCIEGGTK